MNRRGWLLVALAATSTSWGNEPKQIQDFVLVDVRTKKNVSWNDERDAKATVVVFTGTVCPINNAQLPELARIHAEYREKGVRLLGINSNVQDTADDVAQHAKENAIPFPVLRDADAKVADLFGAKRTPEAFVLDAKHVIRYRGRINDQFGNTYKKLAPTTRDLRNAIESVLAGKTPEVAETITPGCLIGRQPKPKGKAEVTFAKHVAPLIQARCQECHRSGQIGPMTLSTYHEVSSWSDTIREVLTDKRMPPWPADPRFGKFINDRHMPAEERDLILKWIDDGCPKGDDRDLPKPRSFPPKAEWRIGKPDLVISMEEEYAVPEEAPRGGIPYQLFIVDPKFKEDVWVERAEAKAGAPSVVHHVLVFIVPPKERIDPTMPSPPFLIGVRNARVLAGMAPGEMPSVYDPGYAIRIPAGSKLVFQMHYTPNGKAQKDRSSVGIKFAAKSPDREIMTLPVYNDRLRIPPGDDNYKVESFFTLKEEGKVLTWMPHMHLRGKDFRVNVITPDGKSETQLFIPHYHFNWQQIYRLQEPLKLPAGSKIHCVAHYDNSAKNPLNPDPKALVGWGDQTWQEMMIGWMDLVYERKPK